MTRRQEERGKLNCKLENLPETEKGLSDARFWWVTVNEKKRYVNASMDITFCFCQGFFFWDGSFENAALVWKDECEDAIL